MRLLLTTDAVGGVWQYATELAQALGPLDVETVLVLLGPPPVAEQRARAGAIEGVTLIETGLELDWLATDERDVARSAARIAEIAGDLDCDIVQLNTPALGAAQRFSSPVISVAHSCLLTWWKTVEARYLPDDFAWRAELNGQGLRLADATVAPTRAFASATADAYALPVLPRAVHNGRTPFVAAAAAPWQPSAFTAGRLWDRGKNVATLDRACALLDLPFSAAGATTRPGGDVVELTNLRALGRLGEAEMRQELARRPIFASAALYEPFGLCVLEAASAGCPLVLSDIPTFRELWEGAALFVPALDAQGFAATIGQLAYDPALHAALGGAARQRAAQYTPAATAMAMLGIYQSLARKDSGQAAA